jgi:hypothetical protein
MWADTLLALERMHLQRLLVWGAISIVTGTALFAWLLWRRTAAPMLRHFAIQTAAWGAINMLIAWRSWRTLALRDFAGTQELLNILWLNTGLDVGYAAVGATLVLTGWRLGPRVGLIGAGIGVMVQGIALTVLDLRLIDAIGPLR